MYYACAVDITTLVALSSIAAEQTKATVTTEEKIQQLLDYLSTHREATIRYVASDMILNINSDASYLSEPRARSRIGGIFFLGSNPKPRQPIQLNGPIHTIGNICKFVVARCSLLHLSRRYSSPPYSRGTWPSATCHASALRQQHGRFHCQRHCQKTTILINGKELLLDHRPSGSQQLQCHLATGKRKPSRLFHKALQCKTSPNIPPILSPQPRLSDAPTSSPRA